MRRRLKRAGIPLQRVADLAGVGKAHVSHVFAGRYASANVIQAAEMLLVAHANAPKASNGSLAAVVRGMQAMLEKRGA